MMAVAIPGLCETLHESVFIKGMGEGQAHGK